MEDSSCTTLHAGFFAKELEDSLHGVSLCGLKSQNQDMFLRKRYFPTEWRKHDSAGAPMLDHETNAFPEGIR